MAGNSVATGNFRDVFMAVSAEIRERVQEELREMESGFSSTKPLYQVDTIVCDECNFIEDFLRQDSIKNLVLINFPIKMVREISNKVTINFPWISLHSLKIV